MCTYALVGCLVVDVAPVALALEAARGVDALAVLAHLRHEGALVDVLRLVGHWVDVLARQRAAQQHVVPGAEPGTLLARVAPSLPHRAAAQHARLRLAHRLLALLARERQVAQLLPHVHALL
jgi:hypothetical protein